MLNRIQGSLKYRYSVARLLKDNRLAFSTQGSQGLQLELTDTAIKRLKELQVDNTASSHLRLTVQAGGCSGFSYQFEIDDKIKPEDRLIERDGVKLVTDDLSLEFIKGSKVDFSEGLIKSAFEVIDNPNAEKGCGCGASFTPK